MRLPVWPTWSEWGRQPLLVTTREQPTAPPSRPASSSSDGEAVGRAHAPPAAHHDRGAGQADAGGGRGLPLDDAGAPGGRVRARVSAPRRSAPATRRAPARRPGTACAAPLRMRTGASSVACSSRLPPQRTRVTVHAPRSTSMSVDVGGEGQVLDGGHVGEHLVAAVGADGDDRGGAGRPRSWPPARRPRPRGRSRRAPGGARAGPSVRPARSTSAARGSAASPMTTASTGADPETAPRPRGRSVRAW